MAKKEGIKVQENKEDLSPVTFFQETKGELDKVVWPSREQLISESVAVLLMVILSATIIYLVDEFFSWVAVVVFG